MVAAICRHCYKLALNDFCCLAYTVISYRYKVQLAAGVTSDTIGKVKAGDLVNFVAQQVGGKGGGKPDMAMAGGTDATNLNAALDSVLAWVTERL